MFRCFTYRLARISLPSPGSLICASFLLNDRQSQLAGLTVQEWNFWLGTYPTAPLSKIRARVAGPFRLTQIDQNLVTVQDITGLRILQLDISVVVPFCVSVGTTEAQLGEVAAPDLNKYVAVSISAVRCNPSKK